MTSGSESLPKNQTTLFRNLSVGDRARLVRYNNLGENYRNRLMTLGLIPGTEFQVQHVAPLGDPVDIRLRGYCLSLRWGEAGDIEVEVL